MEMSLSVGISSSLGFGCCFLLFVVMVTGAVLVSLIVGGGGLAQD